MKKILLSCFLLTATVGITTVSTNTVYAATPTVTSAAFIAKASVLDGQIAAGNTAGAEATWNELNDMMMAVLDVKRGEEDAASPSDRPAKAAIVNNMTEKFQIVWGLSSDKVANRAELNAKLNEFAAGI